MPLNSVLLVWSPKIFKRFLEIGTEIQNEKSIHGGTSLPPSFSPYTREAGVRLLSFPLTLRLVALKKRHAGPRPAGSCSSVE